MPRATRQYQDLSRPIRAFTFTVDAKEEGVRLDALLRAHYPWHSRTFYRRKVERGEVSVNERTGKPSTKVRTGDVVVIQLPRDPTAPDIEDGDDLVILYEDAEVLAVDKPSGMAVHPVGRTRHGTLINKLHARYRDADPKKDVVPRLSHRLDRDTSGVVLGVKNAEVDALVMRIFIERRIEKTYFALVQGVPAEDEGFIDAPMGPDPDADTGMHQAVLPDGQPAKTRWRVARRFARHAWLELDLLTGRTHQLRVHLAHIGHPIVCDHLYGDVRPLRRSFAGQDVALEDDDILLARLGLHAQRLKLEHPITGATLVVESPIPADIGRALEALA
ncbi:MAG: RluA family pseudouridine synthase [Planctomycetota bacterium]|nr:RluA family pseudouridine synthase [Planctomycetota bacterium]